MGAGLMKGACPLPSWLWTWYQECVMLRVRKRNRSKPAVRESDTVQDVVREEAIMAREGQKDEASELLSEDEEAFVQEQLQAGRMQFLLDLGLP